MRQILDDLNSSYAAPSHIWVAQILDQVGDLVREKIKENLRLYLLKTCYFKLTGSIDLWHSKGNDDYIGVIVSYIEPVTFNHSVVVIGVVESTESHKEELIVNKINDIISSFEIPGYENLNDLLYAISHDNCPKIVKGIRDYTSALSTRCGCHTIQLTPCHIFNRGTSKNAHENFILHASEIVQKARKIVGHFHHSAEANHNLKCISAGINEPETDLIQDNETRWDSTHDLIGSVVTKFKSLKIYSLQYPRKIKEFDTFEEQFLAHCYGILSPFKWVTKMLQGDHPTMSIYYPCIKLLLKSMNPSQPVFLKLPNDESGVKIGHDELNNLAKEVRESLLSDLENNIDTKFTFKQKELMGISSFLDPRWKTLNFLEGYERELIIPNRIKDQWCLWNGEKYLQQLLKDKSSIPIFQPPKIRKLHQDLGNFMISLLDESNDFTTSHCVLLLKFMTQDCF